MKSSLALGVWLCLFASTIKSYSQKFTDSRDGKEYATVQVGRQVWMAQNLAYVEAVDPVIMRMGIFAQAKEYTQCYDRDLENCQRYGMLYSWKTAQNVCPLGWHLPSKAEVDSLILSLGNTDEQYVNLIRFWNEDLMLSGSIFVPESGLSTWHSDGLHKHGAFWTSTAARVQYNYWLFVSKKKKLVRVNVSGGNSGAAVRCVKDN